MAVNLRRSKARRRLAAIAFLSDISLEGPNQKSSQQTSLVKRDIQSNPRPLSVYQKNVRPKKRLSKIQRDDQTKKSGDTETDEEESQGMYNGDK